MTKIDIYSGFLGAGKTTLIKKMIREAYAGEQIVLIENEFGEIGIDGGFMQEAGIQVNEMNSGCICCSLVGDFGRALTQVIEEYHPERIIIEPSGVGKLSDVIGAVQRVANESVRLGAYVTVADASKCKVYLKNFGEFYENQIETATTILLSRTQNISGEKLQAAVSLLREHNPEALIITTPWEQLSGAQLREAMEQRNSLTHELEEMMHEHHHHHHHEHDEHCDCGHCHDEHEHHHEHHHHEHDEHCDCEHCHDEHEHHHHHHHHADEVFASWGVETPKKFTAEDLHAILHDLENEETYGFVLRAKGIVHGVNGAWIHFDYVPGDVDVRSGCADVIGKICVIGAAINENELKTLFRV